MPFSIIKYLRDEDTRELRAKVKVEKEFNDGEFIVYLSGSFNSWSASLDKMTYEDDKWTCNLLLPEGQYAYVFVVNERIWSPDYSNPHRTQAPQVLRHMLKHVSLLRVPLLRDMKIVLRHAYTSQYLSKGPDGQIEIWIKAERDKTRRIRLVLDSKSVEMHRIFSDYYFDYYRAFLFLNEDKDYYFEIDNKLYYTYSGLSNKPLKPYFNTGMAKEYNMPKWVISSIFYQIFPDRFRKDNLLSLKGESLKSIYGGNLYGIISSVDYLSDLGVTAIWLNPIYPAMSYHRYDVKDYEHVDPLLGGDQAFDEMIKTLRQKGIKVILDGVFNHCGLENPIFQDAFLRLKQSRYYDWFYFHIREDGVYYETFWGVKMMPKLNHYNKNVRRYIKKIMARWINRGIHGWRLDVAHGVPHHALKEYYDYVKSIKEDAYIFGEITYNPSTWLVNDEMDGTMNYDLYFSMIEFFAKESIDALKFAEIIERSSWNIPLNKRYTMYNFLSNHDAPRLLTLCWGNIDKYKLAYFFLLTYIGVPSIYYGDEIGLEGGHDPDCRRPMKWILDKSDRALLEYFRSIIRLRKSIQLLQRGYFEILWDECSREALVYMRRGKQGCIVI
ncbi:MAG: hypothetical protein DRP08_06390, partial [Candidatus Aenigmatarchaeota archaeon]